MPLVFNVQGTLRHYDLEYSSRDRACQGSLPRPSESRFRILSVPQGLAASHTGRPMQELWTALTLGAEFNKPLCSFQCGYITSSPGPESAR